VHDHMYMVKKMIPYHPTSDVKEMFDDTTDWDATLWLRCHVVIGQVNPWWNNFYPVFTMGEATRWVHLYWLVRELNRLVCPSGANHSILTTALQRQLENISHMENGQGNTVYHSREMMIEYIVYHSGEEKGEWKGEDSKGGREENPGLSSLRSGCFKTEIRSGKSWKTDLWYSCSLTADFLNKNIESLA
jgi:hypothetical protein